jgi:hypothetical protein
VPDTVAPLPLPFLSRLRQETVARLATLSPIFREVYDSRLPQIKRELLPCVRVTTHASSVGLSISIPDFRSTASLVIQIICEDITDAALAERIDRYCDIVKGRLFGDPVWLQIFERIIGFETEIERSVEGEWRLTTATLTLALQYSEVWEPYVPDWLETIKLNVDMIDPAADPNTGPPGTPPNVEGGYVGGYPGPDGRVEAGFQVENTDPPEGWPYPPFFVTPHKGS